MNETYTLVTFIRRPKELESLKVKPESEAAAEGVQRYS
jgi:hypothetical protein